MTNPISPAPDPDDVRRLSVFKRLSVESVHFYFIYLTTEQIELLKDQQAMEKVCFKNQSNTDQ